MNYTITSPKHNTNVNGVDEKQIAEFCVEMCGGGHNHSQVAAAVTLNSRIRILPAGGSLTNKSYTITRID